MSFGTILISNDDGIDAPGLAALVASLSTRHKVYVVAPDRERSGVSQAFTLFNPLRADPAKARLPEGLVEDAWMCSGMPADCVKIGTMTLLAEDPPDLVVTGINKGANMGPDILYSGTVAAALEGHLAGLPAMAVSLVTGPSEGGSTSRHPHFATAGDWALRLIDELEQPLREGARDGWCVNVNVPDRPAEEIDGWVWTDQAQAHYDDRYVVHKDPTGRPHYWLEGELVLEDPRPDCDVAAVRAGKVSVTPLRPQLTHLEVLERLRAGS